MSKTITRKRGEEDQEFVDRVVATTRRLGLLAIDFGGGPMCLVCAPFTGYAKIGRAECYTATCRCYNCGE